MTPAEAVRDFVEEQEYQDDGPAMIAFYRDGFEHVQNGTGVPARVPRRS